MQRFLDLLLVLLHELIQDVVDDVRRGGAPPSSNPICWKSC
ncbi:hypothetical protein ACFQT0_27660 [Hymenobacter humi]|uniref:Uncharacterized protein n=1 Tax=Hymenobacter humi TaxID=1411620 RepID=A0ABW2UD22_9BACT